MTFHFFNAKIRIKISLTIVLLLVHCKIDILTNILPIILIIFNLIVPLFVDRSQQLTQFHYDYSKNKFSDDEKCYRKIVLFTFISSLLQNLPSIIVILIIESIYGNKIILPVVVLLTFSFTLFFLCLS